MSDKTLFYDRLKEQIKLNRMSFNQVERDLGYPRNSLNNYKNGIDPSGKRLVELADYFNVSPQYLIGKRDSTEKVSLLKEFCELQPNEKKELYSICQSWASKQLFKSH